MEMSVEEEKEEEEERNVKDKSEVPEFWFGV